MDWHIKKSDAFKEILVKPLKDHVDISLKVWDGEKISASELNGKDPLIFCMLPPPLDFANQTAREIIWLPMWDQAQGYDHQWWGDLPKNVKVVAFSKPVYEAARKANLKVLRLQFFLDPGQLKPASWEDGRIIYYWNRVGLVGVGFLKKLCKAISAKKLIFKPDIDPRIDQTMSYRLPESIGSCEVETVSTTQTRQQHLWDIQAANIVVASRKTEGVGLEFLESMARGCVVIANNAPTMNEYIIDGSNGLYIEQEPRLSLLGKVKRKLGGIDSSLFSDDQDWMKFSQAQYEELGARARQDHQEGYKQWVSKTDAYARFILYN